MNEQEAICQLKAGNICGLEALYRDHYEVVFRIACGIVRNHHLAEDVTEVVFIELFTAIKNYDDKRTFPPWLHRIAVRRSLDAVKPHKYRMVPTDEADALPSQGPSPEDEAERSEQRAEIRNAIGKLSPKHRAAIVLRYYHGFNDTEMAEILGCRSGAVRSRLHYARRRLGDILGPQPPPLGPQLPLPKGNLPVAGRLQARAWSMALHTIPSLKKQLL